MNIDTLEKKDSVSEDMVQKDIIKKDLVKNERVCCICMDVVGRRKCVYLDGCEIKHYYHHKCLNDYNAYLKSRSQKRKFCCYCRVPYKNIISKYENKSHVYTIDVRSLEKKLLINRCFIIACFNILLPPIIIILISYGILISLLVQHVLIMAKLIFNVYTN